MANDPAVLADLRERMAKRDPEWARLSDAELAERARSFGELLAPIPPEVQMLSWLASYRWEQQATALVSESVLGEWLDRWAERGLS